MWILSWKKYAISKFATFVSVVGAFVRYAGVTCLVSSLIPAGLICIAIGIALHFCAQTIAKRKAAKAINKRNTANTVNSTPNTVKSTAVQPTANPTQSNPIFTTTAQATANNTQTSNTTQTPNTTQQAPRTTTTQTKDTTTPSNLRHPCPKCGAFVPSTSKFCNECGTEIIRTKKCTKCGAILNENDKFCGQCGCQSN